MLRGIHYIHFARFSVRHLYNFRYNSMKRFAEAGGPCDSKGRSPPWDMAISIMFQRMCNFCYVSLAVVERDMSCS